MSVTTLDNGLISDSFAFSHQYGTYSDALVMTEEEYNKLTAEEITAMKQQRFDNWVAHIETPPAAE